uniref:Uncharacterized protein n=1 Tax=Geospiza parvula TaxID=87175 RepID=A0A8C3NEF9_GEOPR
PGISVLPRERAIPAALREPAALRHEPLPLEPACGEEEEGLAEFPWNSRQEKRYGGFMSSERMRTPLVTLFRNAIAKSFSKDGQ